MMDLSIEWQPQTGQYSSGEDCRVGKVIVGHAGYSAMGSKTDPNKNTCTILLPGIKQAKERFATQDEAKARLERMVRAWFNWAMSPPPPTEQEKP